MKVTAEHVKNSIVPIDFYRHELPDAKLKRHGWNDGGLCPFHDDRKTGNFRVNLTTGAFKCFACGTYGGDIIAFTMKRYGLNFREALQTLSQTWGLYG
jgi:DNA primase